jgi:hypothetical protein
MAFLKPDSITKDGQLSIATTSVGGSVLGGDWLNCIYEGTAATVAQALPAGLKACRVTHALAANGDRVLKAIQCQ